jgi:exosortase N
MISPILKFALRWIYYREYHILAILVLAGLVGGALAFPANFLSNTNTIIGICLLPFAIFFGRERRFNYVYFILLVLFGVLAYSYNVRTFYFFTIAFYILLLLEKFVGSINPVILFLIAIMSPFFHQVSVILGFPVRLQLSRWAGNLLGAAGFDVQVEGNLMVLNGSTFSVDDACMGLSMLSISMLMAVAALTHHYRTRELHLNFLQLSVFFITVFALNVISNLLRIMTLVIFKIPPEDPMHDVIGIMILIIYVVVPLYLFSRTITIRFGRAPQHTGETTSTSRKTKSMFTALAVVLLLLSVRLNEQTKTILNIPYANVEMPRVQVVKMDKGITKMHNDQILVYVKPIPEFFTGEHTPLLCWAGSGFKFQGIKKCIVDGNEIYYGKLEKPGENLFTAWWYTNGEIITVNQWEWRLTMLRGGEKFCLINVTSKDEKSLNENIKMIFENKWLTIKSDNAHVNL